MEDTRSAILSFIQQHPFCTAKDIGNALNLTTADIRYHINILVREGKIQQVNAPGRASNRGRPATTFRINTVPSAHTIIWLCELLIKGITELSKDSSENPLTALLSPYFSALVPTTPSPTLRLNQTIEAMKGLGYEAHWEAHFTGPVLILSNCPYWPLPVKTPHICTLDGFLLEKMSGFQLEQIQRANLDSGHPTTCLFKTISPGSKTGANT
ncbi:MAG: helix-turn-helix transcriptional regulator [Thermanaerothrix sp.]|uniref:Winged helix-turn-helix transcriptional regulator n=1 Tax=Thermanaerothrix solaris TaxID=3058434 RepID=A0ABU3NK27_9CHLR|nr:winged helix-turn-helix transcriptional regulator [Thermanaerothrix sp. 4228-RoL]MDT8897209.1 winged helix-turn-helix transcriptional regulator [Thermanaerothrix sp. 4228-RoL]